MRNASFDFIIRIVQAFLFIAIGFSFTKYAAGHINKHMLNHTVGFFLCAFTLIYWIAFFLVKEPKRIEKAINTIFRRKA